MFRCSECNKEFNIKPDYCDCGNDVFFEIEEKKKQEKPKVVKKSFEERYPNLVYLKKSLDPISVGIFCVCIILSILSLIFIGRGSEITQETETKTVVKTKTSANIDDFWDDKPAYIEVKKETPKPKENVVVKTQKPTVQPTKQITKPKQKTLSQTVTTQKPTTVSQTTKPKQKTSQTTQTTKAPVAKQTANTSSTKNQNVIQVPQTNTNNSAKIQTSKIQVQEKKTAQKATQTDLAELKKYKNALRNRIYSYIDFSSIIGDGTCVITFKINNEGKLINRNFAQKSGSVMLNDAVYNAMLNVPSYKQPPAAYNGETLKFTVKFFSGEYEVSLN